MQFRNVLMAKYSLHRSFIMLMTSVAESECIKYSCNKYQVFSRISVTDLTVHYFKHGSFCRRQIQLKNA